MQVHFSPSSLQDRVGRLSSDAPGEERSSLPSAPFQESLHAKGKWSPFSALILLAEVFLAKQLQSVSPQNVDTGRAPPSDRSPSEPPQEPVCQNGASSQVWNTI